MWVKKKIKLLKQNRNVGGKNELVKNDKYVINVYLISEYQHLYYSMCINNYQYLN